MSRGILLLRLLRRNKPREGLRYEAGIVLCCSKGDNSRTVPKGLKYAEFECLHICHVARYG